MNTIKERATSKRRTATDGESDLIRPFTTTGASAARQAAMRLLSLCHATLSMPSVLPLLAFLFSVPFNSVAYPQSREVTVFLRGNVTRSTQMPLSYRVPPGYWESIKSKPNVVDDIIERLLVTNSVNLYDAALWQIAMARTGNSELAQEHTARLLSRRSGDLRTIKASDGPFRYGDRRVWLSPEEAYFFRMISDRYLQEDPLDGKRRFAGFPTWPDLHQEDWLPITGENAWVIIGGLQSAFISRSGMIPANAPEVTIALQLVPAFEAMRSPVGAIYHAPHGTFGKQPNEISTENNVSARSALRQIRQVIRLSRDHDPDGYKDVAPFLPRIDNLLVGIDDYFKNHSFDRGAHVFYQGGVYADGRLAPNQELAVDCQTWTIAELGVTTIDGWFGEGTAYRMWTETKRRAGHFADGELLGVGFTDGHEVLSGEWTGGAILAVLKAAKGYETSHPEWAAALRADAVAMRQGAEALKVTQGNGAVAYKYSNRRTRIPWGWWGNPIPSVASTVWISGFIDGVPDEDIDTVFNPFVLGGKSGIEARDWHRTFD